MALEKFWAPVPWMLEAAILLELALGKYVEATIIAGLLVFNAALESSPGEPCPGNPCRTEVAARAQCVRPARRHLEDVPAAELVPGDLVKLSLGGVVAADVKLTGRSPARPIYAHSRSLRSKSAGHSALAAALVVELAPSALWGAHQHRRSNRPIAHLVCSQRSRFFAICAISPRSMVSSSL